MEKEKKESVQTATDRKLYVSPVLVEYGSIAKLTQNSTGSFADTGAQMNGACL